MDRDLMSTKYPISSKSWLMFYGKRYVEGSGKKNVALLLPEYNQPKIVHLNSNDVGYYKAEYFCYHDMEKIVYHKQMYGVDHVAVEIYERNGDFYQRLKIKIQGCYDHSYAMILLSPSGRYIFYAEDAKVEPDNPDNYETKTVGKVMELVFNEEEDEFEFETKRTIEDFKERYNKSGSEVNQYNYYSSFEFYLTDNMELLYVNKTDNIVMYEEKHIEKDLEKKLGRRDYNEKEYRTINDMTWVMKNGGFAAHSSEEVFFLKINSEQGSVSPLIKINFQINKGQMTVSKV